MKRIGLIALSMLLVYSLPAAAVSKNPHAKRAQTRVKVPKPRISSPMPANPPIAKKQDGDPTNFWQSYSYP